MNKAQLLDELEKKVRKMGLWNKYASATYELNGCDSIFLASNVDPNASVEVKIQAAKQVLSLFVTETEQK